MRSERRVRRTGGTAAHGKGSIREERVICGCLYVHHDITLHIAAQGGDVHHVVVDHLAPEPEPVVDAGLIGALALGARLVRKDVGDGARIRARGWVVPVAVDVAVS